MLRCVRDQRTREACKCGRAPGERPDAGSNDQTTCKDRLTVFEVESEAPCVRLNSGNLAPIEVGHCLTLVPKSIVDKAVEWHRARKVIAACCSERVQGHGLIRVRDMRRGPTRTKQHAHRHIAFPKRHGLSERMHIQTPDCAQVSGRR